MIQLVQISNLSSISDNEIECYDHQIVLTNRIKKKSFNPLQFITVSVIISFDLINGDCQRKR